VPDDAQDSVDPVEDLHRKASKAAATALRGFAARHTGDVSAVASVLSGAFDLRALSDEISRLEEPNIEAMAMGVTRMGASDARKGPRRMPRRRAKKILARARRSGWTTQAASVTVLRTKGCPYTQGQIVAATKTLLRDQNRRRRVAWAAMPEEERARRRAAALSVRIMPSAAIAYMVSSAFGRRTGKKTVQPPDRKESDG
jgi:hypothetical protein